MEFASAQRRLRGRSSLTPSEMLCRSGLKTGRLKSAGAVQAYRCTTVARSTLSQPRVSVGLLGSSASISPCRT